MQRLWRPADAGASVAMIDDQPKLGGHLRFSRQPVNTPGGGESRPACELAQELAETIARSPNIETFSNATAFGLYQGNLVAVLTDEGLIRVRAKAGDARNRRPRSAVAFREQRPAGGYVNLGR